MERQAQRALVSSWQPISALFHVLIFTVLVAVAVVLVLGVSIVVVVAAQAKLNNALNCAAQLAQKACAFLPFASLLSWPLGKKAVTFTHTHPGRDSHNHIHTHTPTWRLIWSWSSHVLPGLLVHSIGNTLPSLD